VSPETLVLSGNDVRAVLPFSDCIAAVESAFREYGRGAAPPPAILGMPAQHGGFHVKAAILELGRPYFAAKLNGNFPDNPLRAGLPTIQGVVALCDARDGRLLALLDSIEITRLRTGAATAVAARYLARRDVSDVMLFGCGGQAPAQLACLACVLPLRRVLLHDSHPPAAERLAGWVRRALGADAMVLDWPDARRAARSCGVIVTCTSSRRAFLTREEVGAGCFVAAVGADSEGKQELEPELLASGTLVVDLLDQCAAIGELHHALIAGVLTRDAVYGELAELVMGRKPGRTSQEEVTLFDSTGTALQDVAVAAIAYERALAQGRGRAIRLAGDLMEAEAP
jgi:ornithine cyclodeaminase/alanine dehydrogenase-like protein (mu-crystallin family)